MFFRHSTSFPEGLVGSYTVEGASADSVIDFDSVYK